eukprot:5632860-Prymnesium_polylepis.1
MQALYGRAELAQLIPTRPSEPPLSSAICIGRPPPPSPARLKLHKCDGAPRERTRHALEHQGIVALRVDDDMIDGPSCEAAALEKVIERQNLHSLVCARIRHRWGEARIKGQVVSLVARHAPLDPD